MLEAALKLDPRDEKLHEAYGEARYLRKLQRRDEKALKSGKGDEDIIGILRGKLTVVLGRVGRVVDVGVVLLDRSFHHFIIRLPP